MSYRVLIVEVHNLVRRGLRSLVAAMPDFEVVGEARAGKEAIHCAIALKPHLILMDMSMPGIDGVDTTVQIKQRMKNVRVLMLSVSSSEQHVRAALQAGADGYILKDADYGDFTTAILAVVAGRRYLSPEISLNLVDSYFGRGSIAPARQGWDSLTSRERSILKLIAEGSTNRMAGEFLNISAKTVEKHRANLMRKLGLNNAAELVLLALDMGLIDKRLRILGKVIPMQTLPPATGITMMAGQGARSEKHG